MEEAELLEALRRGSTDALEQIIARYGAYVFTVVRNRACGQLTQEDLEEIVSDVFVALWQRPDCVRTDCLKSWLGALARNKAVDRLRRITPLLPLDEDFLSLNSPLWETLAQQERAALVHASLKSLGEPDREIFLRYYDLCESTAEIARRTGLSVAAVKARLCRGRQKLKQFLTERGLSDENSIQRLDRGD